MKRLHLSGRIRADLVITGLVVLFGFCVLICGCASPAEALDHELVAAAGTIAVANWLDVVSTQECMALGASEEGNPWLFGEKAERIVPMKVAIIAAETAAFAALRRRSKKLAWAWVAGIVVANVIVYKHNKDDAAGWREWNRAQLQITISW